VLTIMITAYASVTTAVEATRGGTFDFLPKPFTPNEIKACVRRATRDLVLSRHAKKLAADQRRTRFELIRVLAHELKAPLSAVEGYLASILDGIVQDEETRRHVLTRSIARIQGMRQLIFDLLDVTRLEAGMKARDFSTVQLGEVTRECMDALRPQAVAKHITMEIAGSPNLGLVAVRAEIEIVLNNLLTNAIKYNRPEGAVHVTWSLRPQKRVRISVQDGGLGLAPEQLANLFQPFNRLGQEAGPQEGSGIGLVVSKRLVEMMGGSIGASSTLGVGSVFWFELAMVSAPP
jgi:signal transduction histidine kinase